MKTGRNVTGPDEKDRDLDAMVQAYAGVIVRAVRRVAGPRAAAIQDDVHQAVVVGLWRQLERGQTIERPASYIFRAAIRETIRLLKSSSGSPAVVETDPDAISAGRAGNPHARLEGKEREAAILEALATLEPKRQQAVRAHLSGFDVREIMTMFEWPYQTARHLIARGMADLRQALRERGIDE